MDGYEVLEKLGSGSFGTIRRIVRKSDKKVFDGLVQTAAAAVECVVRWRSHILPCMDDCNFQPMPTIL